MADTEHTPGVLHISAANLKELHEALQQLTEARRGSLDWSSSILERSIRLNENGASLYEKMMLLDGGTIALSVTMLGSLSSRGASGHVPEHAGLLLLCPAWALLLISIYCCWICMMKLDALNNLYLRQFQSSLRDFVFQDLGLAMEKWAKALEGQLESGAETVDLSKLFLGVAEFFKRRSGEETVKFGDSVQNAGENIQKTNPYARCAFATMVPALMSLCAFALRILVLS